MQGKANLTLVAVDWGKAALEELGSKFFDGVRLIDSLALQPGHNHLNSRLPGPPLHFS